MGRPIIDLTGQRFGSLLVVSVRRQAGSRPMWECRCDCGGTASGKNGELRSGRKTSCHQCARGRTLAALALAGFGVKGQACLSYRHGDAGRGAHTKEYRTWASMIRRCEMPSQASYPAYGGRGIKVCDSWRGSFEAFLEDMGRAPTASHTIDRIENDGHYEPGNVRWAPPLVQANNKRQSVHLSYGGTTLTVAEWARKLGIKYQTLWARIFIYEWPIENALAQATAAREAA